MGPEQTRALFAANPADVQAQRLLKEPHELSASGAGDSVRADAIRDETDLFQRQLDPREFERIEQLSADLYMLDNEETFQPVAEEEKASLGQRISQAFEEKRYPDVLGLFRLGYEGIPRAVVAYVRGRCWMQRGDYRSSLSPMSRTIP